ncbi:RNA binding protein [Streptomyces phage YDN12]|uniref:RNA binding protein n=1 Tax=Streptomyces phage YDN12 TaxID=1636183 RepID=A0A0E3M1J7_9CAUD|nr:ATPase [Streptomyces phage YDN12]AKA61722.1 RNA binding protein [Streptomyces phage YDN12]
MNIEIISFGYLHGDPPAAHITLDLRHHFRDPHVHTELRYLTAHDTEVQRAVSDTAGIPELLLDTVRMVHAFGKGPTAGTVRVAVGCAGGRHRAASFAMFLGSALGTDHVEHRDLSKPVVDRDAKGNRS